MSEIDSKSPIMTPQISPKDVPQSKSDSETEDEPVVANIIDEASSSEDDDDGDIVNEISGYVPLSMNDGNDDSYSNTIEVLIVIVIIFDTDSGAYHQLMFIIWHLIIRLASDIFQTLLYL